MSNQSMQAAALAVLAERLKPVHLLKNGITSRRSEADHLIEMVKAAAESYRDTSAARAALQAMVSAFQPFTLKPMGAPNSEAREQQEAQVAAHAAALSILRRYEGSETK